MQDPRGPFSLDELSRAVAHLLEAHDKRRDDAEAEAQEHRKQKERLTSRVSVAALAVTVAISFVGYVRESRSHASSAASTDAAEAQAEAEASWAFYQAKNEQRHAYRLADDELARSVQDLPPSDPRVSMAAAHHAQYTSQISEITLTARELFTTIQARNKRKIVKEREAARISRHTSHYDMGTRILTLAVILFSVTLLANKPKLFWAGVGLAFFGAFVAVNGYFLFVG
jgi:Domain of unknown function (DUF4337)